MTDDARDEAADDRNEVIAALAVPDSSFREAHLAAARTVLNRVIDPAAIRLAFASGSLAAGLGHGMSDVDLYVALTDGVPAERSYAEGGYMVQISAVSAAQLALIARSCAGYSDTAASRPQMYLTDTELQRCVRYAIGTVLIERDAGLPSQEDAVLTVRRILMNRHAYLLSDFAEDTLGALRVGDLLTALRASAMALECAVECALAAAGDVYLGRKFQLRRLARTLALREVLADSFGYLRDPVVPGDQEEITSFVIRRMLFGGHLVSSALLDGWDKPLSRIPPFRDCRPDGGTVRSPWVTAVRFADSWGMAGVDSGFRTTAAMVRLWRSLDGRDIDAVQRGFEDDPVLAGISRERLDLAISQLVEKKTAVPDSGSLW